MALRESELVTNSVNRLKRKNISVKSEVPLLGRYVDIVYLENGKVITIEFKLHDWKRAIKQARDHLLGSDYSYICMPKREINNRMRNAIEKAGLGLMFYQEDDKSPFNVVIRAPRSKETWTVAYSEIVEFVRTTEE